MDRLPAMATIGLLGLLTTNHTMAISTDDKVSFSTQGQSLFNGPDIEPKKFKVHLIDEHIPETVKGDIRRLPEELPVSTLQSIWQKAIDTCTSYEYTLKVSGITLATIKPSESECIKGEIQFKYCTLPLQTGWSGCTNNWVGDYRKTWIRDIGQGIGPKPTQPASRDYDMGMIVTYSMDVEAGIEGHMILDPGTVDVSLGGRASISSNANFAAEGEIIRIDTTYQSDDSLYHLRSRFPNLDFSLGTFMYGTADVRTQYAGVNYDNGEQIRGGEVVYSADSRTSSVGNTTVDGVVRFADTEWLGANFSTGGVDIRIKETEFPLFSGAVFEKELVVGSILPVPNVPGVPFAGLGIYTAELDTPVSDGHNCGDCVPLREFVDMDGVLHNTSPTGLRPVFSGLTDGSQLTWPVISDGMQDNDLARIDLDMDVISLIWGMPLEFVWESQPVKVKFPKLGTADFGPAVALNAGLLDIDISSFFSLDQHLSFDPNMQVTLNFDKAVDVRLDGETEFQRLSKVKIKVGDSVEIIQPAGGVKISPMYQLDENRFVNDSKIKISSVLQETLLEFKLYGVIPDAMGSALGMPTHFAALKLSPDLMQPQVLAESNTIPVSLDGFVDQSGKPVYIGLTLDETLKGNPDNESLEEFIKDTGDAGASGEGDSSSGSLTPVLLMLLSLMLLLRKLN